MDMDQAAVFLAGSILTASGFLIWFLVILLINNLVHKYWKSWGWKWMNIHMPPSRFMTDEEYRKSVEPTLDKNNRV